MDELTQQKLCDLPRGLELLDSINPALKSLVEAQATAFCVIARQLQAHILAATPEEVGEEATPGACWGALIALAVKIESTNDEETIYGLGVKHLRLFLDVIEAAEAEDEADE